MVDILVTFRKVTCSLLNMHFKRCKPSITHAEIIHELSEFGDLPYGDVSTSSVSRAVKYRLPSEEQFTYKKITRIIQERFTLQNMAYTQIFIDYLHTKNPCTLFFFDGCVLKLPEGGIYEHAPVGEWAVELNTKYHS